MPNTVFPNEQKFEGTCTICGNKQSFYLWDDAPLNSENKFTSKQNSPYIEKYCYKCAGMRVFTL